MRGNREANAVLARRVGQRLPLLVLDRLGRRARRAAVGAAGHLLVVVLGADEAGLEVAQPLGLRDDDERFDLVPAPRLELVDADLEPLRKLLAQAVERRRPAVAAGCDELLPARDFRHV